LLYSPESLVLGRFSGSHIIVRGTIQNGSTNQDPAWECFIDNIEIAQYAIPDNYKISQNAMPLCQSDALQDGPHVLIINVTVLQHTFWFDEIQYIPSSNVPLDNSTVMVVPEDPAIQYGSGWALLFSDDNRMYTETTGSNITYEFFGP
jgi:hypothetical protein